MDDKTSDTLEYVRFDGDESRPMERPVVREVPWTIHVDDQELITLFCTPSKLNFLVLGFLAAEGVIESLDDVLLLEKCEDQEGVIDVKLNGRELPAASAPILLSGCGRGITFDDLSDSYSPIESSLQVSAKQITELMRQLRYQSPIHEAAGGTHTSALSE